MDKRYEESSPTDISKVVLPNGRCIFLSNLKTARRPEVILKNNIKGIVSLHDYPEESVVEHETAGLAQVLPIHISDETDSDLSQHFEQTREFINHILSHDGAVLIHCWLGFSRSSTIGVAYLIQEFGMSVDEALNWIKKTRPHASPNRGFLNQLKVLAAGD